MSNRARNLLLFLGLVAASTTLSAISPPDCNRNGEDDAGDIAAGASDDCNGNGIPDECDLQASVDLPGPRIYPAGEASSIAAGDVDGDSDADIVTADPRSDEVLVLLNDGNGVLASPGRFAVSGTPESPILADFDGDGDLDVAVRIVDTEAIQVLANQGRGAYSPSVLLDLEDWPESIAAGDIDGDRDIDLVTVVIGDTRMGVFENDGSGKFAAAVWYEAGDNPHSLVLEDFDRDGHLDAALLVAEESRNTGLSVLYNDRNGAFAAPVRLDAGTANAMAMIAGDMDGDADPDLVVMDKGSWSQLVDAIVILTNQGAGFGRAGTFEPGYHLFGISAGDIDGDADTDIIAAVGGAFTILNDGEGNLTAGDLFLGGNPIIPALMDPDGALDLVSGGSGGIGVLLGQGGGSFPTPTMATTSARPGLSSIWEEDFLLTADLDGDADLDIVTGSKSFSLTEVAVSLSRNEGERVFGAPVDHELAAVAGVALDLDGSRGPDLAIVDATRRLSVLYNRGAGDLAEPVSFDVEEGATELRAVSGGDLDGDGDLDLVVADVGSEEALDSVLILPNDGEGAFGPPARLPAGRDPQSLAAVDLDGDGSLDLACANAGSDDVFAFLNQGGGAFRTRAWPVGERPRVLEAGDIDGDGSVDLATADQTSDTVSVLWNLGGGALALPVSLEAGPDPVSLAIGDLDGDGDGDIASGTWIYLQEGRSFARGPRYDLGGTHSLAIADMDGDGTQDLLSAFLRDERQRKYQVCVFWNDTVPPLSRDRDASGRPDECESRAVSSLAARPDPVVIEGGARAIGFAGSLEAESLEEDLVWKGAVFENVGPGDASVLTDGAKLYSDANGNGALDAGDEELGSAAFDPATQKATYQGLSRVLARGVPEPFLLVLDLHPEPAGTRGGAALSIPGPRPFLAALCLAGLLGGALSRWNGRLRRLAWAPALVLLAAFVVPAGCDGDGGGSAPASSRMLRMELVEVDVAGLETGLATTIEGLPQAAWSFDA